MHSRSVCDLSPTRKGLSSATRSALESSDPLSGDLRPFPRSQRSGWYRTDDGSCIVKELIFHRQLLPALERWPDRVAFHDGEYHATFQQHGDRVLRLADGMRRTLGMKPDDRFAVMSCNSHQYLELYHAGFLGAGIINPLNLRLGGGELQHIMRDSGASVVFVDEVFADHFARNIAEVREGFAASARRADRRRRRSPRLPLRGPHQLPASRSYRLSHRRKIRWC